MKKYIFLARTLLTVIFLIVIGTIFSADAALAAGGMTIYAFNPVAAMNRDYYERISAQFKVCAPGYLRVEQTISNVKPRYTFDVKKNQSSDIATERKLDLNDKFAITHLGVFLCKQTTATIGKERLYSYPNNAVFSATGEADYLETLYNGYLDLKVGQTVIIEALSMQHFRYVPIAQQEASNFIDRDQWNIEDITYWPGSVIYLDGSQFTEINITCPAPSGQAWAGSSGSNKIVLQMFGFLLKGASGK